MTKFPPKKIQKISALVLMVTATVMIFMTVASFFSVEKTSAEVGHMESIPYWQYVNNDFSAYVFNNYCPPISGSFNSTDKYFEQYKKECKSYNRQLSETFTQLSGHSGKFGVLINGQKKYALSLFFDTSTLSGYSYISDILLNGVLTKCYFLVSVVLSNNLEEFQIFGINPLTNGRYSDYFVRQTGRSSDPICVSIDNYHQGYSALCFSLTLITDIPTTQDVFLWYSGSSYEHTMSVYLPFNQYYPMNAALTGDTRFLPYTNLDDPSAVENFNKGYNNGLEVGRKEGLRDGETIGFGKGLKEGKLQGNADINSTFESFFPSVFGGIATFLMTILDFKIFGISALTILGTFGAILLLGFIIKLVKG